MKAKDKPKYIYLIRDEFTGYVKIGIGVNPNIRLKQLQTGNPNELTVCYKYLTSYYSIIERILHRQFNLESVRIDSEWFDLTLIDIINIDIWIKKYESNLRFIEKSKNDFL